MRHFFSAFLGSGDQSIRGPLTKLFGFGLSIMEKMAVVKIVTEEDERRTNGGRTENSFLRYLYLKLPWDQCNLSSTMGRIIGQTFHYLKINLNIIFDYNLHCVAFCPD